jgi:hypothetical protein
VRRILGAYAMDENAWTLIRRGDLLLERDCRWRHDGRVDAISVFIGFLMYAVSSCVLKLW